VKDRAAPLAALALLARAWQERQGRATGDLSDVLVMREALSTSRKVEVQALPTSAAGREASALLDAAVADRGVQCVLFHVSAWKILCDSYVAASAERLVHAADRSQLVADPPLLLAASSSKPSLASVTAFTSLVPASLPFVADDLPERHRSLLDSVVDSLPAFASAAEEQEQLLLPRGKWVKSAEGRALQRFHVLRLATGDVVVRKGPPATLRVVKGVNAKGKAATVVLGLEAFDADLVRVARTLAKACACSATVVPVAATQARAVLTSSPDPDAVVQKLELLVGIPASLTRIERIKRIAAIGIVPQSQTA
jgi:Translation initiation factor SUI1